MPLDSDERTAIRRANLGITDALSRCSHYMTDGDEDRMYTGYVEAVMWVRSLDELYTRSSPGYIDRRDPDPGGQIVHAICWARDKGIHQLVNLHGTADRPQDDLGLGPSFPDGSCAVVADLGSCAPGYEGPTGRPGEGDALRLPGWPVSLGHVGQCSSLPFPRRPEGRFGRYLS
jgi:hypothetical protein